MACRPVPGRAISAERFLFESHEMTQDPFSQGVSLIVVPDLGVSQQPITLVNWLVSPGSSIIAGERIAELLVDSILFHLESEFDGKLERLLAPTGSQVKAGESIAEVFCETTGEHLKD
jgi:pyruvate/2-oxoglutarate dehydrogenase complex dihydrolipoamide acyltransferase (E2) component